MLPPPTRPRATRLEFSVVIPARKRVTTSTLRAQVGEEERDGIDEGEKEGSDYESADSEQESGSEAGLEEVEDDGDEGASDVSDVLVNGKLKSPWPTWRFPGPHNVKKEVAELMSLGPVELPSPDCAFGAASSRELFIAIYAATTQRGYTVFRVSRPERREHVVLGCLLCSKTKVKDIEKRCPVRIHVEEVNGRWKVIECMLEHNTWCVQWREEALANRPPKKTNSGRNGARKARRAPVADSVDEYDRSPSDDEDGEDGEDATPSTPTLTAARSSRRSRGLSPQTLSDKRPRSASPSSDSETKPEWRPRSAFPSPISETKPGTRPRSASPSPEKYVETKPDAKPETTTESLEAELTRLRDANARLETKVERLERELELAKQDQAGKERKKARIGM